jgi:hypothetical protein
VARFLTRRWRAISGVAFVGVLASAPVGTRHADAEGSTVLRDVRLTLSEPAEVVAVITAGCEACAWGEKGREAAVLRIRVDGRYSQDLPLVQGRGPAVYRVLLGRLEAGAHAVAATLDPISAPGARGVSAEVAFEPVPDGAPAHVALAHAPILHQRANAVGRFTDVPLLMYYEPHALPSGTRVDYSVVFSHEDGGTPADRLMATWGRVTDIELVYSVELDADGAIVREAYQGEDHAMPPFAGRREGRHPLLWVVTDNNMLSDRGQTTRRHRPAPQRFELKDVSREAVMDAHPWTYRVMAEEVRREGRVDESEPPASGKIPDPRRFVFLEACAEVHDATLAFDLGMRHEGTRRWIASDAADPRFRVARSGCFRAAAALPKGADAGAVEAVRLRAHTRPPRAGEAAPPAGTGRARLTRINRLFMLGDDDAPGKDLLRWTGDAPLAGEAPGVEIPVATRRRPLP